MVEMIDLEHVLGEQPAVSQQQVAGLKRYR